MNRNEWILLWAWVAFVALIGPALISARDWFLVAAGFAILAALVYLTQRRVRQYLKGRSE